MRQVGGDPPSLVDAVVELVVEHRESTRRWRHLVAG
jgi:hypothetical protein